MSQYLNGRQWREWMVYGALFGLGADRTDISLSHQTFHMIQAWVNGDTRQPKDFAPQFSDRDSGSMNEADQIMSEIRAGYGS